MSQRYDDYLREHKANVIKGYEWMVANIPDIVTSPIHCYDYQNMLDHDKSKTEPDEYWAYDEYFYGKNKSYAVVEAFNIAWLRHIHRNPHHWQHWVLIKDDPGKDMVILDMPDNFIIEMICDWWSFSWVSGDLFSIFQWYRDHKEYIKLSDSTRRRVEKILNEIKIKLEETV